MKDKPVQTLICLVAQHPSHAFVNIAAHRPEPAVQLTDDVRIANPTNNNALISGQLHTFKLHGVRFGYEFGPSNPDRHAVNGFKGSLGQVEGPGTLAMQVGV